MPPPRTTSPPDSWSTTYTSGSMSWTEEVDECQSAPVEVPARLPVSVEDEIRSWDFEAQWLYPPRGPRVYQSLYERPNLAQAAGHYGYVERRDRYRFEEAVAAAGLTGFFGRSWTERPPWTPEDMALELFNCDCDDTDCGYCHPTDCDCDRCHQPPLVDDQVNSVADDFSGLPAMPAAARRRCRFGIEIEFNKGRDVYEMSRRDIANELVRRGIAAQSLDYTHSVVPFWKIISDASVTGGEAVSPVLDGSDRSLNEVREVMRVIKERGGVTGNNCGMHVHLDITGFRHPQLVTLGYNLERAETALAAFVPAGRRGEAPLSRWANNPQAYDADRSSWPDASESGDERTGFCRLIRPNEWEQVQAWLATVDPTSHERTRTNRVSGSPLDRNVSFNFNAVMSYGTVECRLLGYTLNTLKVRAWVRALQTVIYMSQRRIEMPGGNFIDILCEHGLGERDADTFREVVESRGTTEMLAIT